MELKELNEAIEAKFAELKERLEQRDEEMKTQGAASTDNAKKLEELGAQIAAAEAVIKEQEKAFGDFEAKMKAPGMPGSERPKSIGEQWVESDEYKGIFTKTGHRRNSDALTIPVGAGEMKTLTTASTSAGALAAESIFRQYDVFYNPDRRHHVRELLSVIPVGGGQATYIQETGFYNMMTTLTVAGAPGDGTLTVDSVGGLYAGQTLTLREGANTASVTIDTGGIDATTKVVTLTGAIGGAHTYTVSGTKVTSTTWNPTAEASYKPAMDLVLEELTCNLQTVATWLPVTNQLMHDAPRLRAYINGRMQENLFQTEDRQVLYGSGTSPQIQGITTAAGVQTYAWSSGDVGDNRMDAILRAATLASVAEYDVDAVLMNWTDWARLATAKGTDGHYVMGYDASRKQVWAIPAYPVSYVTAGTFLVGAFKQGAELFDNNTLTLRLTDSHADNFVKNILVMLLEERIGLAPIRPEAFVLGTWDSAPAGP